VHQTLPSEDDEHYESTQQIIHNSIEYMKKIWTLTPSNNRINYKCRNMDEECSYWAAADKCEEDDDYMEDHCAPACQTCHLLDIQLRCPIEEGNEAVFEPGRLNQIFENIVDDADGSGMYAKYNPVALSRPRLKGDGSAAPEGNWQDGPWVVILEDFTSDEEAYELIAVGHKKDFVRSKDVGIENPDGSHEDDVSEGRTSTNAWCDAELCGNHPVIRPVIDRIATLTSTPVGNSEHLQLLRYEPGQYYKQHHDYIEYQQGLPCGVRMLTVFLYLNDVDEGGGTRFPLLDLTVEPKKGRALLWPSVLDADPEAKDKRTDHEALPVIRGIKYGANAWIHSRNYQAADEIDCT
jgi:prolyl 4-hydroxylase